MGLTFPLRPRLRVEQIDRVSREEKEPGFLFPGCAGQSYVLLYAIQGELHCGVGGQDIPLRPGELILFAPEMWYMYYAEKSTAPRFALISFDAQGISQGLCGIRLCFPGCDEAAEEMLRLTQDDTAGELLLHALAGFLLTAERKSGELSRQGENPILRHAQQYIGAHVRDRLSVPLVARMVGVSPSYLTALFHRHLQISPGEYIRRSKLQESKRMIWEESMNFTEIAAALHYSTVHHFSRQFKQCFGMTPSEYAHSARQREKADIF